MDEILRARKLTEEILARAASIKSHMSQVNQSMANMALMESERSTRAERQAAAAVAAQQPARLLDLPDDVLRAVAAAAGRLPGGGGAAALACLAATCRRWCGVVGQDGELWEAMCRRRWGTAERLASFVPVTDPHLMQLDLLPGARPAGGRQGALGGLGGGRGAGPLGGVASLGLTKHGSFARSRPQRTSGTGQDTNGASPTASPTSPGGGGTAAPGPMSPSSPGAAAAGGGYGGGGGDLWEPAPLGRWLAEAEQQRQLHKPTARHSASGSLGAAGSPGGGAGTGPAAGAGEPPPGRWCAPPATANPWRLVYRDRTVGWRVCRHVFRWLQAHGCPAAVSGSLHRQQLVAGLRYLGLCTAAAAAAAAAAAPATATPSAACTRACTGEAPGGCCCGSCSRGGTTSNGYAWAGGGAPGPCPCPCRSPQAALAVELLAEVPDLVPCLLSLLSNDSALVVELAAGALANLLGLGDGQLEAAAAEREAEAKREAAAGGAGGLRLRREDAGVLARTLLASNSGRSIASQLRQGMRSPGVLRELTRCLANLWAHSAGGGVGPAGCGAGGGGGVQVQVVAVPPVVPLLPPRGSPGAEGGAGTLPHLQRGVWQLQEYSARGDPLRPIHLHLDFAHPHPRQHIHPHQDLQPQHSSPCGQPAAAAVVNPGKAPGAASPPGMLNKSGSATSGSPGEPRRATYAGHSQRTNCSSNIQGVTRTESGAGGVGGGGSGAGHQRSSWAGERRTGGGGAGGGGGGLMVDPGTGRPLGATAAALLALGGGRGGGRERIAVAGGGYDRMMAGGGPRTAAAAYATAYEAAVLGLAGARGAGGAGAGGWSVEEFVVEGWVDVVSGEWQLERRCVSVPFALKYKGYSDAHGCWGMYTVQQGEGQGAAPAGAGQHRASDTGGGGRSSSDGAAAVSVSSVGAPRIFRLFRDPCAALPPEAAELLAAVARRHSTTGRGRDRDRDRHGWRARGREGPHLSEEEEVEEQEEEEAEDGGVAFPTDLPHLEPLGVGSPTP